MDVPTIAPGTMEDSEKRDRLQELYQRHHRAILSQVRHQVPPQDAEDVLCAVMDRLLDRMDELQSFSPLRQSAYIRAVTRNAVADYLRGAVRARERFVDMKDEDVERISDGADSVAEAVIRREQVDQLKGAIRRLPADKRALLEMKYTRELDDGEIANRLGVSREAVRQQLSRLRKRLRGMLEEDEQ